MPKLPAELKPEQVIAVIDTREKTPLDLAPLQSVAGALTTGDYSVAGLEHIIAIERKSLPDLVACVGRERERFEKEVQRLLAYPTRALVVESTWAEIEAGRMAIQGYTGRRDWLPARLDSEGIACRDGRRPRTGGAIHKPAAFPGRATPVEGGPQLLRNGRLVTREDSQELDHTPQAIR